MKFPARAIGVLAFVVSDATAFAPYTTTTTTTTLQKQAFHSPCLFQSCDNKSTRPLVLQSSTTSSDGARGAASSIAGELSDEELAAVQDLVQRSSNTNTPLQELVADALPTMHPSFIIKLRAVTESNETGDTLQVARALQRILDSSLAGGREVLAELLHAGEIRKLDAAIGKFARQGRLDMAFFQVLSLNLQDASQEHEEEEEDGRSQILRHIYTRCQEEVEKTVPGGVALLNKLLRTEMESIRANQLEHYLCPRPNIITSPDGTEIELKGKKPVLVPPSQFMNAISDAVKQIRTVEKAGGTDKESAANLVESCRQVASEARVAIAKNYGVDSAELKAFEDGLMPVFRPTSPDSPFIQGQ
jgi:hypothetical protein